MLNLLTSLVWQFCFGGFSLMTLLLLLGAWWIFSRRLTHGQLNSNWILAGLLFLPLAMFFRLTDNNYGFLANLLYFVRDLGLTLLATSIWLRIRGTRAKPFFVPSIFLLGVYGMLATIVSLIPMGLGWLGLTEPASSTAAPTAERNTTEQTRNPQLAELLVELGPDDHPSEIEQVLQEFDATWETAFPHIPLDEDEDLAQYLLVRCPANQADALLSRLRANPEDVDQAARNAEVKAIQPLPGEQTTRRDQLRVNDPLAAKQWALAAIGQPYELLPKLTPQRKARIAIIDTGVDGNHEDLQGVFINSPDDTDRNGHGTHCAGLAGCATNNGVGVASLNWEGRFIEIMSFAGLNKGGSGTVESVAEAITLAAEAGADVISLSLGGWHPTPPKAEVDAVEYALKLGAIVVVAAGNSSDDASEYAPANIPGVICVAATDQNGVKARFSNTNAGLDMPISAPGVDILSLKTGGDYVAFSGTSMSTPIVSGLVGVLKALNPSLTARQAWELLSRTAAPVAADQKIGPQIDARKALQSAAMP